MIFNCSASCRGCRWATIYSLFLFYYELVPPCTLREDFDIHASSLYFLSRNIAQAQRSYTMKGLHLRSLTGELCKVKRGSGDKPAKTIRAVQQKFRRWQNYLRSEFDGEFDFPHDCYKLPARAFDGLSFDELCKIHYSSGILMDKSVTDLFETKAQFEVVRKIESSMWRWGFGKGCWNEVVEAYNRLRQFSFGHPDFEIRLDYTTFFNQYGRGKFSRVYFDGVFAYLVYYKREHVMTIGFSIQDKKRILIQQVQTTARNGNRWLYRLPSNRLEFVISLFRKNFPRYALWVIDGDSLVHKTLTDYTEALNRADRVENSEDSHALKAKIRHLEADRPRLSAFYTNTGQFGISSSKRINGLVHHKIIRGSSVTKIAA